MVAPLQLLATPSTVILVTGLLEDSSKPPSVKVEAEGGAVAVFFSSSLSLFRRLILLLSLFGRAASELNGEFKMAPAVPYRTVP